MNGMAPVPGGVLIKLLGTDVWLEIRLSPDSKTTEEPNLQPIFRAHIKTKFSVLPSKQ